MNSSSSAGHPMVRARRVAFPRKSSVKRDRDTILAPFYGRSPSAKKVSRSRDKASADGSRRRRQSLSDSTAPRRERTSKVDFGLWTPPPRSTPLPHASSTSRGRPPLWSPPPDDSPRLPLFRSKFKQNSMSDTSSTTNLWTSTATDHEPLAWLDMSSSSKFSGKAGDCDGVLGSGLRPIRTRLSPRFGVLCDTSGDAERE